MFNLNLGKDSIVNFLHQDLLDNIDTEDQNLSWNVERKECIPDPGIKMATIIYLIILPNKW
jgi:hypothetical protein